MTSYRFTVLGDTHSEIEEVPYEERLRDHEAVLRAYFRTFEKRAYVEESLKRTEAFLRSVFERILVQDAARASGERHLLIWDLLHPITGPEIVDLLATSLNKYDYAPSTRRGYLGEVRRLCDFVLAKSYIPGRVPESIAEKYGPPLQPFSQYDYPAHAIDDPRVDPALTGLELRQFLEYVRVQYIGDKQKKAAAQRNYAMIVLAVTGGMRANELVNLDIDDLRYDEKCIWIRFGKGYKGSGKRHRLVPFTKFAQATLPIYETQTRPLLSKSNTTAQALFLSESGKRITYDAMRLALLEIVESARKAGIDLPTPFGWHDLRRSFATEYLDHRPEDIVRLSKYMGHSGLGTLHRYIRPSRRASQRATESVARPIPSLGQLQERGIIDVVDLETKTNYGSAERSSPSIRSAGGFG